jgi:putative transposase
MRFALIDRAKAEFPIHRLCRVLGVSQSGYFAWKGRPACRRQRDDMVLLAHVRSAFALSNGTYGSPRMTRELRDSGLTVGRHRTARLMRENGLRARHKRRFKRTTDSHHAWPVAPNLLDQDFTATGPDEKWGADISYVWTREGWLYLAVVIDLFARRVVGWAGHRRPAAPRPGSRRSAQSPCGAPPSSRADPSLGPGQPILFGRLSSRARQARGPDLDVGNGKLLRQRDGGDVLQDAEIRACVADRLLHPPTSDPGHWPLH